MQMQINVLKSALVALCIVVAPQTADALDEVSRNCMVELLENAAPDVTVGQLRSRCAIKPSELASSSSQLTPMEERYMAERATRDLPYVITPHRPNYIMPFTRNTKGNAQSLTGIGSQSEQDLVKDEEIKFQISTKLPLWQQAFNTETDLFFAFTATAWWQAYADDISSPFRDTNYEPELFFRHIGGPEIFGVKTAYWDIGLNHESNGRADPLSRSWNRVIAATGFDLGDFAVGLRAWYRIPEDDDDDNNPHMHRYYGYGEIRLGWTPNKNTVTAMVRPGTEKGAYELTWSYPLTKNLRLYTQYFNGYGESLLDYNQRTERFGLGIAINDFLGRQ